jgi:hypothetical protein
MDGWMDEWMNGWMDGAETAKLVGCFVLYIYVAFVGTIINILYPSITPLFIADTPISHFNKLPHNFIVIRTVVHFKICQIKQTQI